MRGTGLCLFVVVVAVVVQPVARAESPTPGGGPLDAAMGLVDDSFVQKGMLALSDEADMLKWELLHSKVRWSLGAPITIATFGGSITMGHGVEATETYRHWLQEWLDAHIGQGRFNVINEGHGGTHPFLSRCQFTQDWAPSDPETAKKPALDLVILEYAVNGAGSNHAWSYELLVRSIMAKFPTATMVGFGTFHWVKSGAKRDFNTSDYSRTVDEEAAIARHYGFPYLSARDALYDSPLSSSVAEIGKWIQPDGLHPNALGHQYYAALLARLLASRLSPQAAPAAAAALRPAMFAINRAHFGGRHEQCMMPGKLNFEQAILSREGFELGHDGPGLDLKQGYVTNSEAGAAMLVNASFPDPTFILTAYVLRGWDNIADVRIECVSGCACEPFVLEGTWKQHSTEIVPVLMKVSENSTPGLCMVSIRTLPKSGKTHQRVAAVGIDS